MQYSVAGLGALSFVFMGLGFIITLFWLNIAWRAMRAHEEIADALRDWVRDSE
jgi:hypothetical protein